MPNPCPIRDYAYGEEKWKPGASGVLTFKAGGSKILQEMGSILTLQTLFLLHPRNLQQGQVSGEVVQRGEEAEKSCCVCAGVLSGSPTSVILVGVWEGKRKEGRGRERERNSRV